MAAYTTGKMNNPNAKLQATKKAGSKGVKSGMNPKASATNTASSNGAGKANPSPGAAPLAKYGMTMKKGGMVKSKKR